MLLRRYHKAKEEVKNEDEKPKKTSTKKATKKIGK